MHDFLFMGVRHGTTAANQTDEYRGWSNEPFARLCSQGRDVVRDSGMWMRKSGLKFPVIYSDDLDRAQETAKLLAAILEIKNHVTDERLRPLNVGDFTGKSKADNPLEKYVKNPALKIPGGESMNTFESRAAKAFDDVTSIVEKLGKPVLVVLHGSTSSFLYNTFNHSGHVGYEGLVKPGGVLMFTAQGLQPLTRLKEGSIASSPLMDGTALTGFATEAESRPPRSCWHCRHYSRDALGLGACTNPVVMIDPQLVYLRQTDGSIAVGDQDCCNYYQSQVGE